MRRVFTVAAGAIVCLAAGGAWNDVDIKSRPVVQERVESVGGFSEGRREWGKPAPELFDAVLPDFFEVDFVRVYDEVSASAGADSRGGHP